MLPTLPTWSGMHPLVVHFPIALLLVAPVLVALGAALKRGRGTFFLSALVLMLIGTIGTYVALSTGEAGEGLAETVAGAEALLEQHEELAKTTAAIFTGLTVLFAGIVFGPPLLRRRLEGGALAATLAAFFALYLVGAGALVNTAHAGGRLVHEVGVRAELGGQPGTPEQARGRAPTPAPRGEHDDDDDD
jgi:uncharacterized membrane protein